MLYFNTLFSLQRGDNSVRDLKLNNFDFLHNEVANAQDTGMVSVGHTLRFIAFSNLHAHTNTH